MKKRLLFILLLMVALTAEGKVIKVLAIGNSFSEDAVDISQRVPSRCTSTT